MSLSAFLNAQQISPLNQHVDSNIYKEFLEKFSRNARVLMAILGKLPERKPLSRITKDS